MISSSELRDRIIRAAWLVNPGEDPRQNVRLTIDDGILTEIADVPTDECHLIEPIALLPGFVNAHTHLEFSSLAEPLQPSCPFTDWIRAVIGYRNGNSDMATITADVQQGLTESSTAGVDLIGEITTSDAGFNGTRAAADRVVSFREFIGFRPEGVSENLSLADKVLDNGSANGLSPHAPYSVHPELFHGLIQKASDKNVPIAMHLAETWCEIDLLKNRGGLFLDFLQQLHLWNDSTLGDIRSIQPYLNGLADCQHALAIHCNYLTDSEVSFLGAHPNIAVVYCPRTHNWFGHPEHPMMHLLDEGATVVLGTDSRASNPDLNIFRELQFVAQRYPGMSMWELLPMITTAAAGALGRDSANYRISEGCVFTANYCDAACDTEAQLNGLLMHDNLRIGPTALN